MLRLIEDRALFTRMGAQGAMQVPTRGMIAAGFDHWDTRHGDPNLHTHVIIANRVQGPDGRWRTLDGRTLFLAAVAMSELFDDVFADHLTARLPVRWGFRSRGAQRTPAHEIAGVGDDLLAAFSTRATSIATELSRLSARFHADHGRAPTRTEILKLRQQATLATRPPKEPHPLRDLLAKWAGTARLVTGRTPRQITAEALSRDPGMPLRSAHVGDEAVGRIANMVSQGLVERRATFTVWNVWAETARATRGLRMISLDERVHLVDRVVDRVKSQCVPLNPPATRVPDKYRRPDGASVFTRAGEEKYAHPTLLAAEQLLLRAHADPTGPALRVSAVEAGLHFRTPVRPRPSLADGLAPDQITAVRQITTSGRQVDVLVGPAGSGKTTTLAALATLWRRIHGEDSVIGLAPSATAASQLGAALGIPTENTAKWLHESRGPGAAHRAATLTELHDRRTRAVAAGNLAEIRRVGGTVTALTEQQATWQLRARQLLIVDEATLAGTLDLAYLVAQAQHAGAKLLLVGDHAQLGSVSAGGGFGMLARTGTPTQLHSLWRFTHEWEARATRGLRSGDPSVIEDYRAHGRLHAGTFDEMLDDAYQNWAQDRANRLTSILVAADTDTATELNTRAHGEALAAGAVTGPLVTLAGHCGPDRGHVGAGDTIVTRRNDRSLHLPDGDHVRNGALWTVTATHPDGALTVQPTTAEATQVLLPATYVAEHVDLGYATTTHRAQGITVDTSHTLADPATSREALYVAMTRGRTANHAYLTVPETDHNCHPTQPPSVQPHDGVETLSAILANSQAELSATETQQVLAHQQDGQHTTPDQMNNRPAAPRGPSASPVPSMQGQGSRDTAARGMRVRTHAPAGRSIA